MGDVQTQDGFLRSAGILLEHHGDTFVARLPVTDTLCHHPRVPRLGILATVADCAGGLHAVNEVNPEWPVTADLSLHSSGLPVAGDWIRATSRVLQRRRTGGVFDVRLEEEAPYTGTVARAALTFTTLSRRDPNLARESVVRPGRMDENSVPLDGSLHDVLQAQRVARGLEMTIAPELRNAFGVVAGGVVALLAELEAEHGAEATLGPAAVATSLVLYFLAPAKVGPILATSDVFISNPASVTAEVSVLDVGAGDRPVAQATLTYQLLS
jgi:acyl-coenzyme A thioesterase PaaI-like protein